MLWGQSELTFKLQEGLGSVFGSLCLRNDPGIQLLQRDFTRRTPWKASVVQDLQRKALFLLLGITFAVFWALSAESPAVHFQCQGREMPHGGVGVRLRAHRAPVPAPGSCFPSLHTAKIPGSNF